MGTSRISNHVPGLPQSGRAAHLIGAPSVVEFYDAVKRHRGAKAVEVEASKIAELERRSKAAAGNILLRPQA